MPPKISTPMICLKQNYCRARTMISFWESISKCWMKLTALTNSMGKYRTSWRASAVCETANSSRVIWLIFLSGGYTFTLKNWISSKLWPSITGSCSIEITNPNPSSSTSSCSPNPLRKSSSIYKIIHSDPIQKNSFKQSINFPQMTIPSKPATWKGWHLPKMDFPCRVPTTSADILIKI